MPLKLNVGVSKKIGLPNYGSAGASCYLETDVDGSLIFADLTEFQKQVQQAFDACRRAVTDELANHRGAVQNGAVQNGAVQNGAVQNGAVQNGAVQKAVQTTVTASVNGADSNETDSNGAVPVEPAPATKRQVNYAIDLACQIPGFGPERLDAATEKLFAKPLADITAPEASRLIETLRELKLDNPRAQNVINDDVE